MLHCGISPAVMFITWIMSWICYYPSNVRMMMTIDVLRPLLCAR